MTGETGDTLHPADFMAVAMARLLLQRHETSSEKIPLLTALLGRQVSDAPRGRLPVGAPGDAGDGAVPLGMRGPS